MNVEIRQLEPTDAAELLRLLQQAVTEEPLAFVTSPEDEFVSSVGAVREQLERAPDTVIFGAFEHDMVGMLWFAREARTKLSHKALIWRAFVRKEFRGRGIGGQLLQTAIAHARNLHGLAAIWLGVSDKSPDARRLYEKYGFRVWGIEPDCIRSDGESAQLYYMELRLE
jgi:ribosomal protein S18 acetylase RimI-like enzyme